MGEDTLIEKLSGFFMLQWGWKRIMFAFLSGALSALSMPPFDMSWILFVTFPILIWLIDGTIADPGHNILARFIPSFMVGWWFAFGYFLAGLWWIVNALLVETGLFAWTMPFVVLGLPAFLALFWGLFIAVARIFWSDDWRRLVIFAVFLGATEYLRATVLIEFPWNTIGYAAMTTPIMMQTASVLGVYGITPLAILVFSTPAIFAPGSKQRPRYVKILLMTSMAIIIAHLGFGYWRLQENPTQFAPEVKLRIVQPAILQKDKWKPENETSIINSYIDLSNSENDGITHYIWPESAFPFILTERKDALVAIAEMLPKDTYLITGAIRTEAGIPGKSIEKLFNSVYVINHEGKITAAADKLHLVPFGEYLPFKEYIKGLGLRQLANREEGYTPAARRKILSVQSAGNFLPIICYEIIFSGQIRPEISDINSQNLVPSWIVNVTNDAWFGITPGPYQHHRQAIIRGVEEGLPIVRAANNGISSVSDPYGRIYGLLDLGKRGVLDAKLPLPAPKTLFQQYGNSGFFAISVGLLLISLRRQLG